MGQEDLNGKRFGDRDGQARSLLLVAPLTLLAISPFLFIAATVEPTGTAPAGQPSAPAPPVRLQTATAVHPDRSGFVLPIERTSLLAVIIDPPQHREARNPPVGGAASARSTPAWVEVTTSAPPPSSRADITDIDDIDGFDVDYQR